MERKHDKYRMAYAAMAAVGVTLGLLIMMTGMLPNTEKIDGDSSTYSVRFGLQPPPEPSPRKIRRPTIPEPRKKLPGVSGLRLPDLKIDRQSIAQSSHRTPNWTPLALNRPQLPDTPGLGGFMDAEGLIPKVLMTPMYPPKGLIKGIEGEVVVRFTVDTRGKVIRAEIVSATPQHMFEDATLRAVKKWRFQPVLVDGQPTTITAEQTIGFKLVNDAPPLATSEG